MKKYMVEVSPSSDSILLYEEIEEVMTCIGFFPKEAYALDKEVVFILKEQFETQKPFISGRDNRYFFKINDGLGEVLKILIKIWEERLTFREKLYFIERTQLFTRLEEKKYEELIDLMNTLYIAKRLEK